MKFLVFVLLAFVFLIPTKSQAKVLDGIKNQSLEISSRRKRYVYKRYRSYSKAYRVKRRVTWVAPKKNLFKAYQAASASRLCLTAQTASILSALEARVGRISIVSTCRAGAVIAGSGKPSYHRYGMAVDFNTSNKSAAIAFLKTQPVLVMTYSTHNHIHFNTGQKGTILAANGYGGKRYAKRSNNYYAAVKRKWRKR